MGNRRGQTIIAIDLLRFACAMLVVGYHVGWAFAAIPDPRVAVALAGATGALSGHPIAQAGSVGVELFFVISGMVIARSALGTSWTTFLRHRVLRLAPAAWICATATLLALVASGQGDAAAVADWWRSMRFWPIGAPIDGSYWTLGVEVAFYLMVAAVLGRGGDARRIARIGDVIGAASAAFWIVCLVSGSATMLASNQAAILLLLPHGCLFALGMMIASRPAAGFSAGRLAAFFSLLAVAAVEASAHVGGWRATPAAGAALALLFGGIGVLLIAPRLQPWLARRIDTQCARTIGLMTYPLYLIHQVAGAILLGGLVRGGVAPLSAIALTVVAMLAAAWAVATIAEPALRRPLAWLFTLGRAPAPDTRRNASLPTG